MRLTSSLTMPSRLLRPRQTPVTVHATGTYFFKSEPGKQFWCCLAGFDLLRVLPPRAVSVRLPRLLRRRRCTRDAGEPFKYVAGGGEVIRGWDQGVLGMEEGETREIHIPATEGYCNLSRSVPPMLRAGVLAHACRHAIKSAHLADMETRATRHATFPRTPTLSSILRYIFPARRCKNDSHARERARLARTEDMVLDETNAFHAAQVLQVRRSTELGRICGPGAQHVCVLM
jgi:hypothetical protein